jgi:hypothetical protein
LKVDISGRPLKYIELTIPSLNKKIGKNRWTTGQPEELYQISRQVAVGTKYSTTYTVVKSANELKCAIPGCKKDAINWHHVKHRSKVGGKGLEKSKALTYTHQIPVCQEHQVSIQNGKYGGSSLTKIKGYITNN